MFVNSLYNVLLCIDSPSIFAIPPKERKKISCYTSFSTQLTHHQFRPLSSDVPEQNVFFFLFIKVAPETATLTDG